MVGAPYNKEAWHVDPNELYGPIKNITIARKVMPIETILQEKDKRVEYWKWTQDYHSKYERDPIGAPLTTHAVVPTEVDVPIIETGFDLSRVELARVEASKLTLSTRMAGIANGVVVDENRIAIVGDPDQGVTSFANTTDNSTAVTVQLNVTTEALLKSTLTSQLTQLKTAVGGLGNLKQYPLMLGVSDDVMDVMMATAVTGYAKADRVDNVIDLATALLLKYGNPNSAVWSFDGLGGTVTKSKADQFAITAGALNTTLYPWSKDILSVYASPFKSLQNSDVIKGLRTEITERWVPVFKHPTKVLYGDTAVIA